MNIWEQSFDDLRRPYLEEKNDGNLANNYPPYDKVTRGDVIAGATGKDQMGGKKKKMKSEERKLGGGMKPGGGYDRGYKAMQKEVEKLDSGKETAAAKRYKEMRKEHSDWRSDLGFFTEEDCECDGPMKPKKGIKNKVTINPDLKTEETVDEMAPLAGLAVRAGLAAGTALAGKAVYDKAKGVADKLNQRNQQTQKAIQQMNSFEPEGEEISEREMTSGEMTKEKKLKKKYDPSGMKASMKKQYGAEKGKQVYFATIRKQAMEQFEEVEVLDEVLDTPERANEYAKKNVRSMLGAFAKGVVNKDISQLKTIEKRKRGAELGKRKAEKKAANEEFAGNYEGPLYAPHPDIEEAYKEIDREKENKMYRRAGNLARTALSSKGKKKEEAQKKSSNIVSAITRQKEKERFDRIGQSPKHNEAIENELDYYLGEALRPASERMKRVQTDAGRKKQEQKREKNSKLEAEADKILAGFSKKGTGTAKTKAAPKASAPEANRTLKPGQKKDTLATKANKAMSEQEDKERRGTDYKGRDYGGGPDDKPTVKIPLSGVMQGGWLEKERAKKKKSN